jgi:Flp pilus assembly protein TadB
MSDSKSSSGGIGFLGLLTVAFIVLKLLDKIAWSWWWVLSPIWIPIAIVIVIGIIAFPFWLRDRKNKRHYDRGRKTWEERLDEVRKQKAQQ